MIDEKKLIEDLNEITYNVQDADDLFESVTECINRQPKVGEWIPCSERLPEDETLLYWTTHEDGSLVLHGYKKSNGFIYNWEVDDLEKRKRQGQVIAWIPIFEPTSYNAERGRKNE